MLIIFDMDNTLYDRLGQVPDGYSENDVNKITLFPGAREFLVRVRSKATLVLVTKETDKGLQDRKIDVLGIRDLFDEVIICYDNTEKKKFFQDMIVKYPSEQKWVIGDRIDAELKYGNELGCMTIRLLSGPYKNMEPSDESEVPNHTIYKFEEINGIIR